MLLRWRAATQRISDIQVVEEQDFYSLQHPERNEEVLLVSRSKLAASTFRVAPA